MPGDPDFRQREVTLRAIDRTHQLLSNHVAMAALWDLYRYKGPLWVAQDVDRQAAMDALALLEGLGLITSMQRGAPDPDTPVSITPRGVGLAETLAVELSGE